jgi:hypothetical protein
MAKCEDKLFSKSDLVQIGEFAIFAVKNVLLIAFIYGICYFQTAGKLESITYDHNDLRKDVDEQLLLTNAKLSALLERVAVLEESQKRKKEVLF